MKMFCSKKWSSLFEFKRSIEDLIRSEWKTFHILEERMTQMLPLVGIEGLTESGV